MRSRQASERIDLAVGPGPGAGRFAEHAVRIRIGSSQHRCAPHTNCQPPQAGFGSGQEERRRIVSVGDVALIDRAQLIVGLPNGTSITVTVAVADDGRVTWESPTTDLTPVDGPAQFAVTTAVTRLQEALTKALPDSAFDDQVYPG